MSELFLSCIVPARNEAGNLPELVRKISKIHSISEILIVEGGSTDDTWKVAQELEKEYSDLIRSFQQTGKGKFDAVIKGAHSASQDYVLIWDADGTVPLSDTMSIINKGLEAPCLVTGDRLRGNMEPGSMRFWNWIGNWVFAFLLSIVLRQKPFDLLCGTKILPRKVLVSMPKTMARLDPFGDFAMIVQSKKLGYKVHSIIVNYDARAYGQTNIKRWSAGRKLLVFFLYTLALQIVEISTEILQRIFTAFSLGKKKS